MKTAFKYELKQLIWPMLTMLALLLYFLNGTAANYDGFYAGYIADTYQPLKNYFVQSLPAGLPVLFMPLAFMVMKQLSAASWGFLFTLPLRKKQLLAVKLAAGAIGLSVIVLLFGAGLFYLYLSNRSWMEISYLELSADPDSYGTILIFLFFLWCYALFFYLFSFFIGLLVRNKAAAAVIACVAQYYPFLTLELTFGAFSYPRDGNLRPFRDSLLYFTPFVACKPYDYAAELSGGRIRIFSLLYDWQAVAIYLLLFTLLIYGCMRLTESPRLIDPQGFVIIPVWEKIFCVLFAIGVAVMLARIVSMMGFENIFVAAALFAGFAAGLFGGGKFLMFTRGKAV